MTPQELIADCDRAIADGTGVTLVLTKFPKGFPRGELLCENTDKRKVYRFNPHKVKAWVELQIKKGESE